MKNSIYKDVLFKSRIEDLEDRKKDIEGELKDIENSLSNLMKLPEEQILALVIYANTNAKFTDEISPDLTDLIESAVEEHNNLVKNKLREEDSIWNADLRIITSLEKAKKMVKYLSLEEAVNLAVELSKTERKNYE